MADEITNPRAAANMTKLEQRLAGLVGIAEENLARDTAIKGRQEQILAKQEKVARPRYSSRPPVSEPLRTGGVAGEEDLARVRQRSVGMLDAERRYLDRVRDYNDPRIANEKALGLERARGVYEARQQARLLQGLSPREVVGRTTPPSVLGLQTAPGGYRPGGGGAAGVGQFLSDQAAQRQIRNADRVAQAYRRLTAAGGGRGGAGGGPPTIIPPAGAPGPEDDWTRRIGAAIRSRNAAFDEASVKTEAFTAQQTATLTRGAQQAAASQAGLNLRMQESARVIGLSSDSMRRHGALTTEFISAAARGQTDIRELGFQAGATAAKFAGWTAAAGAVYGLLGAITAIGSGAVQGFDAVNDLQRIITNLDTASAHQSLRDLSAQFNLPISDVGDAAFGMSKIFQDQNSTMKATESALYAVKVGELSAADASRYLTSVVKGFKLEASDLPKVMDAANAAQNRFGGNLGGIVAGVAKAGGAFKNAGGGYRDLIALIQSGTLVTGRTGVEIATALQRSAEIILRPERRQPIIDLLGIDPQDASIVEVYEAAMKKVRTATRGEASEIAKQLSTPQLQSRVLPILRDEDRFREIRRAISPENAAGSAANELEQALKGPTEELKQFVVNLQRLGDALAQSGIFQGVGLLARGTNEVFDNTVGLVELFSRLPEPIRDTVSLFAQLVAVTALLKRFDVGGAISGRFPAAGKLLARRPEALERAQVRQGLQDEQRFLDERRREVSRTMGYTSMTAGRAEIRRDETFANQRRGLASSDEALRAQEDFENQNRGYLAAKREQVDLADQQAVTQRKINNFEERVRRGMTAREAALAEGIYYSTGTLGRPSPTQPVPLRTTRTIDTPTGGRRQVGQFLEEQPQRTFAAGPAGRGADLTEDITGREREFIRNANTMGRASETVKGSVQRMGVTSNRVASTLGRVGAPMVFGTRALVNTGSSLRRLTTTLAAQIGPLEGIFLGIIAAYETYNYINEGWEKHEQQVKTLKASGTLEQIRARSNKELDQRSLMDRIRGGATGAINFVSPFGDIAGVDDMEDKLARARLAQADQVEHGQRGNRYLYQNEIRQRLARRLARARNQGEGEKAIDRAQRELANSYATLGPEFAGAEAQRAAKQTGEMIKRELAALRLAHGDIQGALREVHSLTDLEALSTRFSQDLQLFGIKPQSGRSAGRIRAEAYALLAQAKSPEERAQAISAIDDAQNAITQAAQERMDRLIKSGASPAAARAGYLHTMRQTLIGGTQRKMKQLEDDVRGRLKQIDEIRRDLADRGKAVDPGDQSKGAGAFQSLLFDFSGEGGPDDPRRPGGSFLTQSILPAALFSGYDVKQKQTAKALRTSNRLDRQKLKLLRMGMQAARQEYEALAQEQADAQQDLSLTLIEARTALSAAQTGDPMQQTAIQLRGAREQIAKAQEQSNGSLEDQIKILQLQTTEAQLQQQQTQNRLSREQARDALYVSQARTQPQRDRRALAVARRNIARLRRLGSSVDPTLLIQARTEYNNLLFQQQQQEEQQQESLLDAREALRLSRTDDPVRQARIRLRFARLKLRQADTPEERIRARAEVNTDKRSLRQTIQREKYENIEFDADIERIDHETELARLRRLLKHIRGNKELRRTVLQKIHQLKQDLDNDTQSYELNVGNIKLPTIYEIRRAIQGGRGDRSANVYVTQHNRNDISVARTADVGEVGEALEANLGTGVRTGLRAAGML